FHVTGVQTCALPICLYQIINLAHSQYIQKTIAKSLKALISGNLHIPATAIELGKLNDFLIQQAIECIFDFICTFKGHTLAEVLIKPIAQLLGNAEQARFRITIQSDINIIMLIFLLEIFGNKNLIPDQAFYQTMLEQIVGTDGVISNLMPVNIFAVLAIFLNLFIQNRK